MVPVTLVITITIHTVVVICLAKLISKTQPETVMDLVPNKTQIGLTRALVWRHRKQESIWWV